MKRFIKFYIKNDRITVDCLSVNNEEIALALELFKKTKCKILIIEFK